MSLKGVLTVLRLCFALFFIIECTIDQIRRTHGTHSNSRFFQSPKMYVFRLQSILEYSRKLVWVARCPFSDLSSEGLVKEKLHNRPRRVSLNILPICTYSASSEGFVKEKSKNHSRRVSLNISRFWRPFRVRATQPGRGPRRCGKT